MAMRWAMTALLVAMCGTAAAQDDSAPTQAANPSFFVINRSGSAMTRLYATPAGMPSWGSNRLAGNVAAGGNAAVRLPADGSCVYDLRVVYANGRHDEKRGLNVCEIDNITFPQGRTTAATGASAGSGTPSGTRRPSGNPNFLLVNRGRVTLNELYLSPAASDSWGDDRLGDDVVEAGASKTIRLPAGECVYDMRVVFDNGDANEKRKLNLCDITNLRVP